MLSEEELNAATLEYFCDTLAMIETYEELQEFFLSVDKENFKKILKMAQNKLLQSDK